VDYDELRQREKQRARVQFAQWTLAACAGIAALAGAWHWQQQRLAEREHQRQLSSWIEKGKQELRSDQYARASAWFGAALAGGADTPALRFLLGWSLRSAHALTGLAVNHGDTIDRVGYNRSGSSFITYGVGVGKLWDARSGQLLRTLERGPKMLQQMWFAPGDRYFAVSGLLGTDTAQLDNNRAVIWDLSTGRIVCNQPELLWTAAGEPFDAAGERVVTVSNQDSGHGQMKHTVHVWRIRDAQLLLSLPAGAASLPRFSSDGRRLVTGGEDGGPVQVWDASNGRLLATLHQRPPYADTMAVMTPDGRQVLTAAETGQLRVWDAASGELLDALGNHAGFAPFESNSADGRRWLSVGQDGFRVWDLPAARLLFGGTGVQAYVYDNQLSGDGTLLLTPLAPAGTSLWSVDGKRLLATLDAHAQPATAAALDPAGMHVVTGSGDGSARIWSTASLAAQPVAALRHGPSIDQAVPAFFWSAQYSADGRRIVTGAQDGIARIWDGSSGALLHELKGHELGINSVAISADGALAVSGSKDRSVRLWNAAAGTQLHVLSGHDAPIERVLLSPDAQLAASLDRRHQLRVWRTGDGALQATLTLDDPLGINALLFSRDGRYLVASCRNDVLVYATQDGSLARRLHGHTDRVRGIALSPDGSTLSSAGEDNTLRLWRLDDGSSGGLLDGKDTGVDTGFFLSTAWAPDGHGLIAGTSSGAVILWSPATRRIRTLAAHADMVPQVGYSPDGALAFSGDRSGNLRIWDADRASLLVEWHAEGGDSVRDIAFSADGTRLLYGEKDSDAAWLLDTHREPGSAAQIATFIRCRVPWKVDGDALARSAPDSAACTSVSGGAER
ncbi:MAG TPA: hypothetical protein VHE37_07630, partial [Nevskiaceae bacterium]|nr:hypothetical protein [Nevskiaceae bacterium]